MTLLLQRDQRLYKKKIDYYFGDLSLVNAASSRGILSYCLEKTWRSLQHLTKVQQNYTAMDLTQVAKMIKTLVDKKQRTSTPEAMLTAASITGISVERSTDIAKVNLLVYVLTVMPYFMAVRMPGDSGNQENMSLNRVYTTLTNLIKKGKQQCSSAHLENSSKEDVDHFIREEVQVLIGKLIEVSLDSIIPFSALSSYANSRLKVETSMKALESIFKERVENDKLHKMYHLAVKFAQKNFKPSNGDAYSIENECKV